MTDASSVTTVVVGDRLPWPDDQTAALAKGPFDASAIHHSGVRRDCEIKKISVIHGEESQALAFAETLRTIKPKAQVIVPEYQQELQI